MDEVCQMLSIGQFLNRNANPFAAVEQFNDYFPGENMVPEGGAWIMVKTPPSCEYTVTPLSFWFAEPWPIQGERHCSHRVKIITPRGELGFFPREYSLIKDPGKFYEFVGQGITPKFFGNDNEEGIPRDKLFYLRSRGISKADAITMLVGSVTAHSVLWLETSREVCEQMGFTDWPADSRNACL